MQVTWQRAGAHRRELLDRAEWHVRKAVDHSHRAGETWQSYEASSGKEQIDELREKER